MYAPQIERKLMRSSGYAARRMWKEARARTERYAMKQTSAMASEPHLTAARFSPKSPTALKNEENESPIEASEGTAPRLDDRLQDARGLSAHRAYAVAVTGSGMTFYG